MTIEERAMAYANNNPHGNPYNWNAHHDAYKDGATEQKAIDIDKACEWLKARNDYATEEYLTELIAAFRKAMED